VNDLRRGITGAIIAGGSASRFGGRPKGLEIVGNSRIIDRVADSLRPSTASLLIATSDPAASGWVNGASAAPDLLPGRASAIGIHGALSAAAGDMVAAAWDMPFIPASLVASLAQRLVAGVSAVVPRPAGRAQPLCAAYSHETLDAIDAAVRAGNLRMTAILEALPGVAWIDDDELRAFGDPDVLFLNVNTDADLERARVIAGLL
jgi:molybdopterin-guanine dinucleotide biosynthesis protein A